MLSKTLSVPESLQADLGENGGPEPLAPTDKQDFVSAEPKIVSSNLFGELQPGSQCQDADWLRGKKRRGRVHRRAGGRRLLHRDCAAMVYSWLTAPRGSVQGFRALCLSS